MQNSNSTNAYIIMAHKKSCSCIVAGVPLTDSAKHSSSVSCVYVSYIQSVVLIPLLSVCM